MPSCIPDPCGENGYLSNTGVCICDPSFLIHQIQTVLLDILVKIYVHQKIILVVKEMKTRRMLCMD